MSGTHAKPALASYRDKVTEMIEEGVPFGDVEDAINAHAGLTEDQKGALWLFAFAFAFSLRDRSEQQREARAQLTAVQVAAGDSEAEQVHERKLGDAVAAVLSEQARSGKARATAGARPRKFDA